MMKKTKITTIAIATALTTLLSAGAVFADTTSSNTVQTTEFCQTQRTEAHSWFKSHVDTLLTSATLNESQESDKGNHYGQFRTVLTKLVKAGSITQDQEDAILSGTKLTAKPAVEAVPAVEASHVDIKTVMDGLVQEGVITQAQEDAIQTQLDQLRVHQRGHQQ